MANDVNWDTVLFRASAMGNLMTEARAKTEILSQTCKTYLRQLYREKKYGIKKEVYSKYFDKGITCEEDGITLYSRFKQRLFKKNDIRVNDKDFTGEPDVYEGKDINNAEVIIDNKSSWDAFTFPFPDDTLDKGYMYQGQTYMALTGAKKAVFAFTLIDTPEYFIQKEIDSIKWQTGIPATEEQASGIRRNMTFSDKMSIAERVCEFAIERDEVIIQQMRERVKACRQYLIQLDKTTKP